MIDLTLFDPALIREVVDHPGPGEKLAYLLGLAQTRMLTGEEVDLGLHLITEVRREGKAAA